MLDVTEDPKELPAWVDPDDMAYVTGEFQRTGFRGGLNWYRAIRRTSNLMAPWRGCMIPQPALFIAGTKNDAQRFPGMQQRIDALPESAAGRPVRWAGEVDQELCRSYLRATSHRNEAPRL